MVYNNACTGSGFGSCRQPACSQPSWMWDVHPTRGPQGPRQSMKAPVCPVSRGVLTTEWIYPCSLLSASLGEDTVWGLGWWVVTCLPTGSFLDILHLVWQACRQTEGLRGKEECWSKDYFKWDLCFNDCFLRSSQKAGCQICRQTCSEEVHRASSVAAHGAVRHSSA